MTRLIGAYRPCVGIMIINRDGFVWVGRRPGAPDEAEGPGKWWQMPQGGIDDDEEPATAALRELSEETGITSAEIIGEIDEWLYYDLPEHLQGKAWGGRYRGQKQKWFAVRFTGPDAEINIAQPGHQIEFEIWEWASAGQLLDLIVPFKRDVYARVVAEFSALAIPAAGNA